MIQIQFNSFLEVGWAVLPNVMFPYGVMFDRVEQCRMLEYLGTEQGRFQEVVLDTVLPGSNPRLPS